MRRKKSNSHTKLKKAKKKLKATLGRRSRRFIKLICNKCKREYKVRVNRKDIYTDEVKANWICLSCDEKDK